MRRRRSMWKAAIGLGLTALAGCQTWVPEAGITLPSPHYLRHPPSYLPKSPPFPLPRELASQEEAAAQQVPAQPQALGGGIP